MNLKQFLEFVEIRTKLASLLPFIFGSVYVLYDDYSTKGFDYINFVLMFLSLIFIDMSTTAINNYIDYKKSNINDYKVKENVIGSQKIELAVGRNIIIKMLLLGIVFGLALTIRTNFVVLVIGVIAFVAGVTYTYGPTPISRTPYGEVVSGFMMGFVILFLSVYVHEMEMINLILLNSRVLIEIDYIAVAKIFLISVPFVLTIGNIMLANNICDLEMDRKNNRLLLPHYIGKEKAVSIFSMNYYIIYGAIIISILAGVMHSLTIVIFATLPIVIKNIKIFKKEQVKSKTFVCAVKNLMIIGGSYIVLLILSTILKYFSVTV